MTTPDARIDRIAEHLLEVLILMRETLRVQDNRALQAHADGNAIRELVAGLPAAIQSQVTATIETMLPARLDELVRSLPDAMINSERTRRWQERLANNEGEPGETVRDVTGAFRLVKKSWPWLKWVIVTGVGAASHFLADLFHHIK